MKSQKNIINMNRSFLRQVGVGIIRISFDLPSKKIPENDLVNIILSCSINKNRDEIKKNLNEISQEKIYKPILDLMDNKEYSHNKAYQLSKVDSENYQFVPFKYMVHHDSGFCSFLETLGIYSN